MSLIGEGRKRSLLSKGSFTNDLAWVFSFRSLGMFLGILLTPVLTRIYSPEMYGEFAFFLALLKLFVLLSTFRFPQAFVLPDSDADFYRLFRGSFLLVLLWSFLLSLLGLFLWGMTEGNLLEERAPSYWPLLIGPGLFFFAFPGLLTNWNIRIKAYKKASYLGVFNKLSVKGTSIGLGYGLGPFTGGLLIGEFVGKILMSILFITLIIKERIFSAFKGINWADCKFCFQHYSRYPRYILPGHILERISVQAPVYGLMFFFGPATLGAYSLATGMLNIPSSVLIDSISPIYLKRIRDLYQEEGLDRIRSISKEYFSRIFWVGLLPVMILFLVGEEIFPFLFGKEWERAGVYVSVMVWFVFFKGLVFPLTMIYRVIQRENKFLELNVSLLASNLLGIAMGILYRNPLIAVSVFSVGNVLVYVYYLFDVLRGSGQGRPMGYAFKYLAITLIAFLLCLFLKTVFLE